jgi:hypothetical protein
MKKVVLAVMIMCLALVSGDTLLLAGRIEYDSGPIDEVSEGKVYISGQKGAHVLELLENCPWCEVGLEVLVAFSGSTYATLKPYSEHINIRPIRTIIIRDGRQGE